MKDSKKWSDSPPDEHIRHRYRLRETLQSVGSDDVTFLQTTGLTRRTRFPFYVWPCIWILTTLKKGSLLLKSETFFCISRNVILTPSHQESFGRWAAIGSLKSSSNPAKTTDTKSCVAGLLTLVKGEHRSCRFFTAQLSFPQTNRSHWMWCR